jgi:hypothetical protein
MKLNTFNILFALLPLILCSQISEGAVKTAAQPATSNASVINEDSSPWRRDPFIGKTKKLPAANTGTPKLNGYKTGITTVQDEEISLQGIMKTDNAYHALINGRVVKAGNNIGTLVIKQISRYQVVLQNEKKERLVYDIYQGRIDKDRGKK